MRQEKTELTSQINEWLVGIKLHVQVGDECLSWFDIDTGTIQESVFGPI